MNDEKTVPTETLCAKCGNRKDDLIHGPDSKDFADLDQRRRDMLYNEIGGVHPFTLPPADAPAQEQQGTEPEIDCNHACCLVHRTQCCKPYTPQPPDPLESIATELLRLEDWRKELSKERTFIYGGAATGASDLSTEEWDRRFDQVEVNQRLCAEQAEAAWQRLRERLEGK